MNSLSHVRLFAIPWTVAYQVPPFMGFSRQAYWSGLPLPSPGDLPDPGIEPRSPTLQANSLPSEPTGRQGKRKSKQITVSMRKLLLWAPEAPSFWGPSEEPHWIIADIFPQRMEKLAYLYSTPHPHWLRATCRQSQPSALPVCTAPKLNISHGA